MKRRLALLATTAAALGLAIPAGAGAGSDAQAGGEMKIVGQLGAKTAGEELVTYVTSGKLKVTKVIRYRVVCAADCNITTVSRLKLKGPDLPPVRLAGAFPAGSIIEVSLKPNGPALKALKANVGAAKMVTKATATNVATGEVDSDARNFKFKGKKKKKKKK